MWHTLTPMLNHDSDAVTCYPAMASSRVFTPRPVSALYSRPRTGKRSPPWNSYMHMHVLRLVISPSATYPPGFLRFGYVSFTSVECVRIYSNRKLLIHSNRGAPSHVGDELALCAPCFCRQVYLHEYIRGLMCGCTMLSQS
jgi:hypothetical protein